MDRDSDMIQRFLQACGSAQNKGILNGLNGYVDAFRDIFHTYLNMGKKYYE